MPTYKAIFSEKALRQLKKTDTPQQRLITRWVNKNLDGCENPRAYGRPMVGDKKGYWRYRVGAYRLVAEIDDGRLVIVMVNVGHRQGVCGR